MRNGPSRRSVAQRVLRLISEYGGVSIIVACFVGMFALLWWGLCYAASGTSGWIGSIEDPAERGLAYIAAAVVLHAFFSKR